RYKTSQYAPKAQMSLGWVAFYQKDYAGARKAFEAVTTLFPNSDQAAQARLRAGDSMYYMKDYAGAAAPYEKAPGTGGPPLARDAKSWLAICRVQQGDKKGAVALLQGLAADGQDNPIALRARLRLADLQLEAGDVQGAADTYGQAAGSIPPDDAATLDQV